MMCCTRYCAAEAKFDRKVAERDLRSYHRDGAAALTKLLLSELRRWPLEGADILDVGGGIGVISMELAAAGIRSATVVEASPAYLEVARREVGSRYGSRPTQFVLGDFAAIAPTLADAEALLRGVAARARRLVALTYPRDRWYMRTWTGLQNFWRKLSGNAFRSFIHPPQRMDAVLEAAGFVRATQQGKGVWVLDLFHREGAALPGGPDLGK